MLVFGYFGEVLATRFSRKRLFVLINALSICFNGLIIFSFNYSYFLTFSLIISIANGAFLPIGFSIVSDLYSSKVRGKKFGMLQFSLVLGNGLGVALGGFLGWKIGFFISFLMGIACLGSYLLYGNKTQDKSLNPEIENLSDVVGYNYNITISNMLRLLKNKTILGIFISVFCYGIAISTLANWGIYYLTFQLKSETYAILLHIITGIGALPGAIIGGVLGDLSFRSGKPKARIFISFGGLILGIILLLSFYLQPLLLLGFFGYFFISFANGNQFAIYSDVAIPELRGTVNSLSGIMLNIGGITGNMLISTLIQGNLGFLSLFITLVLVIWLCGSFSWIVPYFYYSKESESRELLMINKSKTLQMKSLPYSDIFYDFQRTLIKINEIIDHAEKLILIKDGVKEEAKFYTLRTVNETLIIYRKISDYDYFSMYTYHTFLSSTSYLGVLPITDYSILFKMSPIFQEEDHLVVDLHDILVRYIDKKFRYLKYWSNQQLHRYCRNNDIVAPLRKTEIIKVIQDSNPSKKPSLVFLDQLIKRPEIFRHIILHFLNEVEIDWFGLRCLRSLYISGRRDVKTILNKMINLSGDEKLDFLFSNMKDYWSKDNDFTRLYLNLPKKELEIKEYVKEHYPSLFDNIFPHYPKIVFHRDHIINVKSSKFIDNSKGLFYNP